jgi:hypothetical protein
MNHCGMSHDLNRNIEEIFEKSARNEEKYSSRSFQRSPSVPCSHSVVEVQFNETASLWGLFDHHHRSVLLFVVSLLFCVIAKSLRIVRPPQSFDHHNVRPPQSVRVAVFGFISFLRYRQHHPLLLLRASYKVRSEPTNSLLSAWFRSLTFRDNTASYFYCPPTKRSFRPNY